MYTMNLVLRIIKGISIHWTLITNQSGNMKKLLVLFVMLISWINVCDWTWENQSYLHKIWPNFESLNVINFWLQSVLHLKCHHICRNPNSFCISHTEQEIDGIIWISVFCVDKTCFLRPSDICKRYLMMLGIQI